MLMGGVNATQIFELHPGDSRGWFISHASLRIPLFFFLLL